MTKTNTANLRRGLQLEDLSSGEAYREKRSPAGFLVQGRPYRFPMKLFRHQYMALRRSLKRRNLALFMDPGTGKTAVAIHSAGIRHQLGEVNRVLIFCPKSVMGVWVSEIRKHLPDHIDAHIEVVSTKRFRDKLYKRNGGSKRIKKADRPEVPDNKLVFWITNHEASWRLWQHFHYTYKPDLIISDECHRIKNPRSKQSKAEHSLSAGHGFHYGHGISAGYRLALTGTPITQGLQDIFAQFRFLFPHEETAFGKNWFQFQARFLIKGGYLQKQIVAYKNLEGATEEIKKRSFIATKDECLDLPGKTFQTVPIELEPKTRRLYREMAEELVAQIESGEIATAPIVLVQMLRLAQITGGHLTDANGFNHHIGDEKLDACEELVEDRMSSDRKVVVFCRFIPELKALVDRFTAMGLNPLAIYGDVSAEQRTRNIEAFQTDDTHKVIVCQIASGSLGITLTAADTCIFYSLDYSLANYLQALDRIHRIGQEKKVTYLHLLVPGSVDTAIYRSLRRKADVAQAVLRRPRALLLGTDEEED